MNKLFEEEVIVDENERLLDTLKFLTEIEREDGEKEDTWAWLDSAMDFEGRTEEELIKFCQDNGFKVFRVTGDGETAGGLVAAGASVTPEQIQAEYADFYEVKPEVIEIESEKKNESLKENFKSRKLHEGTANFRSQDAFDMYAIDDKELVCFEDWTEEEKQDYENGDYNYFEACAYDYREDLDRLTDELTEQLEYFTITYKGGYNSGIQSYVFPNCNRNTGRDYENDNIEDAIYDLAYDFKYYDGMSEEEADKKARELINAEVEKINKELLPRLKEVGMYKIAVSARFSNGETWYSKVEENLKEGFRGCPDIEMIWHGETNDPELEYKGVTFNYWDVEDALWQDFIDEHPEFYGAEGEKEIEAEDAFNQYCREHAAGMLDDWIAAKNEGLKEAKFGFKQLTKNNIKNMSIIDLINNLAYKAASYWVNLPEGKKSWYEDQGTAMIFENWDEAYSRVLNATEEECKELGVMYSNDGADEVFDLLDEKMWEYVEKIENGEMQGQGKNEGLKEAKLTEAKYVQIRTYDTKADFEAGRDSSCDSYINTREAFNDLANSGEYYAVVQGRFSCKYNSEGCEYDDKFEVTRVWPKGLDASHLNKDDSITAAAAAAKNKGLKEGNEDVYLTADFLETDDDFYIFLNDIVSGEDDKNWEGVDEEEKQILLAAREFHGDFFEKCGNKEFKTYEEFLAALKAVYDEGDYPLLECNKTLKESLTKEEWLSTIEGLKAEIEKVENKYSQNNCEYILDREAENLPVEKYIVKPTNGKYKNFYTFTNEFFNVYVDGWYHNWSYGDERPAVFPRGYKAELERTIKNYCKDHNLYCELRKAYRATVGSMANTAAFLIAIQPETKLDGGDILSDESLKEDKDQDKLGLPREVEVSVSDLAFGGDFIDLEDSEITELLSDYLSDTYGFCHYGFKWKGHEQEPGIIICYEIDWDTSESLKEAKNPFSMSKEELEIEFKKLKDEMSKIRAKNHTSNYLKDLQARLDKIAKAHAKYGKFNESKKEKELLITPDYKGINSDGTTTDLGASE